MHQPANEPPPSDGQPQPPSPDPEAAKAAAAKAAAVASAQRKREAARVEQAAKITGAKGTSKHRRDGVSAHRLGKLQKAASATFAVPTASVALVCRAEDDCVLLTRETRSGVTKLNLPGGKGEAGETLGQAAAREAHEETGKQLTEGTRDAIAAIAHWAECDANQGHAAALRLAAGSPDATVHERFDRAAANASRGSKTVHIGLEWHPLSVVSSHAWRAEHMHFPGQHRLAAAVRLLAPSAPSGPSGPSGSSGSGSGSGGPDAPPSALNLGDAAVDE